MSANGVIFPRSRLRGGTVRSFSPKADVYCAMGKKEIAKTYRDTEKLWLEVTVTKKCFRNYLPAPELRLGGLIPMEMNHALSDSDCGYCQPYGWSGVRPRRCKATGQSAGGPDATGHAVRWRADNPERGRCNDGSAGQGAYRSPRLHECFGTQEGRPRDVECESHERWEVRSNQPRYSGPDRRAQLIGG